MTQEIRNIGYDTL